ncbi:hypothetical protein MPTK1_2g22270 [Marchantia polymorpha subsp. ruderalis]|nr:hypothetical protein MARPO_0072s0100 [Marchantia polymorpha]BBN03281.1 hypothetical protein Mp_2g22270 [Marchantia polymorpha subsp. ruderalis]|eukprot:PTQ35367.1 hypothetical protein MARPO_0072s0100 [Marchantia polymorpha]
MAGACRALAWVLFLFTILWDRAEGQQDGRSDGLALEKFMDSVRPGHSDNYNATVNPCDWNAARVQCVNSGRVSMLNLTGFGLSGQIPPGTLSNLTFLTDLNLSDNNLTESLPIDLPQLANLVNLNLARNNFSGSVTDIVRALSALVQVDLSTNKFEGDVLNAFQSLRALTNLDLSGNNFNGTIPDGFCDAPRNLRTLHLGSNRFTGLIPTSFERCASLLSLNLSSNSFVGPFPDALSKISTLEELHLARNDFSGPIPDTLFQSLRLRHLNLAYNSLTNPVSISTGTGGNLSVVDLESNLLDGDTVISNLLQFPQLRVLKLGRNKFSGPLKTTRLPALLLSPLEDVDLHGNNFSGKLPSLAAGLLRLDFSSNSFSGPVPGLNDVQSLEYLDLSFNQFEGGLPPDISLQSSLKRLGLADNQLSGSVPSLSAMVSLEYLDLSSNLFTGAFPSNVTLLSNLTRLNVADNGFSSYTLQQLVSLSNLARLEVLNLSRTNLGGNISSAIGDLKLLKVLDLSFNDLVNDIPAEMGKLKDLENLNLASNHLQGAIPDDMTLLTSLSSLDLSNNNLSGIIPTKNQWLTYTNSSFAGNPYLCGLQLNVPDSECSQGPKGTLSSEGASDSDDRKGLIIGLVTALAFVVLVAVGMFIWCRVSMAVKPLSKDETRHVSGPILFDKDAELWAKGIKDPHNIPVVMFEKPLLSLTFADLLQATANFNKELQIADGGYGPVYKGMLADGTQFAIKVLVEVKFADGKDAVAKIEALAKIKHPNLVTLAGYCLVGEDSLLIHEYMVNGDLQRWLHELPEGTRNPEDWSRDTWEHLDEPNADDLSGEFLSWPTRHKIALGVARGLAFLHHGNSPHVVHRDVKASNILLDESFEARLVDAGLAGVGKPSGTPVNGGTMGYVPPEYGQTWQATTRGDVYSFGVVLLELVTGRMPTGHYFHDSYGGNLVGWVRMLIKDKRELKALDPKLVSRGDVAQIQEVLRIGYLCTAEAPSKRPTMQQVVGLLKDCQPEP